MFFFFLGYGWFFVVVDIFCLVVGCFDLLGIVFCCAVFWCWGFFLFYMWVVVVVVWVLLVFFVFGFFLLVVFFGLFLFFFLWFVCVFCYCLFLRWLGMVVSGLWFVGWCVVWVGMEFFFCFC